MKKRPFCVLSATLLSLALPFVACDGRGGDVYVVGEGHVGNQRGAVLWKNNGAPKFLGGGGEVANSVFVDGKDVYVAGNGEVDDRSVAMLWVNDDAPKLLKGGKSATSVFVYNDDVYVAGSKIRVERTLTDFLSYVYSTHNDAMLWRSSKIKSAFIGNDDIRIVGDHEPRQFEEGFSAESLFVHNHDVYFTGYGRVAKRSGAVLWVNGNPRLLNNDEDDKNTLVKTLADRLLKENENIKPSEIKGMSDAKSVFIHNDDVYVVGTISAITSNRKAEMIKKDIEEGRPTSCRVAALWKNASPYGYGLPELLHGGTEANSVFVNNKDVYIVGEGKVGDKSGAVLWKNGYPKLLNGGTKATSVFVRNKDVYVVGEGWVGGKSGAILWKNDDPPKLLEGGDKATSVFVK